MTVQAKIILNLEICGPFLCSGTAPASWGFDSTFDRDYLGRPYIDRSHIKGKLREAMKEIATSKDDLNNLNKWFGKEGPMENGSLFFSDLRLKDPLLEKNLTKTPSHSKLHRIAMDNERRVVKPNALLVMENAFPGGRNASGSEKSYTWIGTISYVAEDETVAKTIKQEVLVGLKWLAACGAEKSIGFGRLKAVEARMDNPVAIDFTPKKVDETSAQLTLTITTEEPLMLGDIRIKESNYQESMEYITGNTIKGALAQALNMVCGVERPVKTPIDEKNEKVNTSFPNLAKYFSSIRFTHAFPSAMDKRPVIIPYSVVRVHENHYDVALHKALVFFGDQLPAFQTDWKDGDYPKPDVFGWATPLKYSKTRTAIDNDTRRADDGSMFTYQYVCPCDEEINAKTGKRDSISWIGGVYLDGVTLQGKDTLAELQGELECALELLRYLGKRASRVNATVTTGPPKPYQSKHFEPKDNMVVVALQSDALMVNAKDLVKEQTADKLMELYKAYWAEITKDEKTGKSCCELSHFFAMQKLRGGFLRTNILKRNNPNAEETYYPYYLTEAGSVFVLQIKNPTEAQKLFDEWHKKGLTLPPWAVQDYGKDVWKKCPYVPENGYGEVIINMDISALTATEEGGTK